MRNRVLRGLLLGSLSGLCLLFAACPGPYASDFVGSWTCTDAARTYEAYHCFMEFRADGTLAYDEYLYGLHFWGDGDWWYRNGQIWFMTDGGAEFLGTVEWGSGHFEAVGYWSNNTPGTIEFVRSTKAEAPVTGTDSPQTDTLPLGANAFSG